MIGFCERVISYTGALNQAAFLANERTYDATLRNLELIGEAATHIPVEVRELHSEIPWNSLIGARNQLAHGYMSMDDALVWTMVEEGVPNLLPQLQDLLEGTRKEST